GWINGVFYDSWNYTTVVPVKKKGDSSNPDNYRGISLLSNTLKIINGIIAKRILNKCVEQKYIHRSQAGFMSKEESVAQALSLYELSTKRTLAGLKTFICFIDLNKAYDSVPHEACLKKIEDFGIRGRALSWIRKLYENPSIGCRTPDGTTPPRPYRRGT
ncbi:RNA-directed DNA polymerase (reverse transcriptase) domain protein, partial [mine drainage metagenome]